MDKTRGRIRLILADDHAVVREGTRQLLERYPDLKVVGEAADGEQAVNLARQLRPDLVVMDVRMPRLSGVEATRRATFSGVAGSINSAGVGYMAFAMTPDIKKMNEATITPKTTPRTFRISFFAICFSLL